MQRQQALLPTLLHPRRQPATTPLGPCLASPGLTLRRSRRTARHQAASTLPLARTASSQGATLRHQGRSQGSTRLRLASRALTHRHRGTSLAVILRRRQVSHRVPTLRHQGSPGSSTQGTQGRRRRTASHPQASTRHLGRHLAPTRRRQVRWVRAGILCVCQHGGHHAASAYHYPIPRDCQLAVLSTWPPNSSLPMPQVTARWGTTRRPPGPRRSRPRLKRNPSTACLSRQVGRSCLVLFIRGGMHMQPLQSCATPTSSWLWAALFL